MVLGAGRQSRSDNATTANVTHAAGDGELVRRHGRSAGVPRVRFGGSFEIHRHGATQFHHHFACVGRNSSVRKPDDDHRHAPPIPAELSAALKSPQMEGRPGIPRSVARPGPITGPRAARAGTFNIQSRAVDDSGNIETPSGGITLTLAARTCPCSIWNSPVPGTIDDGRYGRRRIRSQVQVRYQRFHNRDQLLQEQRKHGNPRRASCGRILGTLLASGTFTGESASGWQKLAFASPVAVTANTAYVASYYAPAGSLLL